MNMDFLHPKYQPKRFRPLPFFAGEILIFIVIFAAAWLTLFFVFNFRAYSSRLVYDLGLANSSGVKAVLAENSDAVPARDGIIIPLIGVEAPIVVSGSTENTAILKDLEKGVVLYPGSAAPGKAGKTVILGHSSEHILYPGEFPTVFSLIDKLGKGDEIIINFGGRSHKYIVQEKSVKAPRQILTSDEGDGLYLMSCWPVGTDYKRMVVKAMLVQ